MRRVISRPVVRCIACIRANRFVIFAIIHAQSISTSAFERGAHSICGFETEGCLRSEKVLVISIHTIV